MNKITAVIIEDEIPYNRQIKKFPTEKQNGKLQYYPVV